METWIGLTVAEVLSLCGAAYEDVTMVDEPPGKLRAVEFECRQGAERERVRVEFVYDASLFSAERTWPAALVGPRVVVGATRVRRGAS